MIFGGCFVFLMSLLMSSMLIVVVVVVVVMVWRYFLLSVSIAYCLDLSVSCLAQPVPSFPDHYQL